MKSAERVSHLEDKEFIAVHVGIARAGPEVCVVADCIACRQAKRGGNGMGGWQIGRCVGWIGVYAFYIRGCAGV